RAARPVGHRAGGADRLPVRRAVRDGIRPVAGPARAGLRPGGSAVPGRPRGRGGGGARRGAPGRGPAGRPRAGGLGHRRPSAGAFPGVGGGGRRRVPRGEREGLVAGSVLDDAWMDEVDASRGALFTAEGLLMYLELTDVEQLLGVLARRFPGQRLVFDALPR